MPETIENYVDEYGACLILLSRIFCVDSVIMGFKY